MTYSTFILTFIGLFGNLLLTPLWPLWSFILLLGLTGLTVDLLKNRKEKN